MRKLLAAALFLCFAQPALAQVATTSSASGLTLDQAVQQALARNPTAQTAELELQRARALLTEARAGSMPTITANGSYTHLDAERRLAASQPAPPATPVPGRVIAGQESVNANVTLAVPLFAPLRWGTWEHARDQVLIAGATTQDVRRQVALFTGRAWLQVAAQARVVDVSLRAQAAAKAHADYAQTRQKGGLGNRVDVVRAAQQLAQASARLESARTALARAREALGVLVGADGPADIAAAEVPEPPALEEALATTEKKRADLRALELRRRLARTISREAWADYVPFVTGTFAPFYQDPPSLTQPKTGWQAQILLTWQLYDGGLRYGAERERRLLAREAGLSFEGAARQAKADVRGGYEAVQHADAALAAARDAAKLAHEGLDLANLAYQAGATTNLEVIDAERTALDADTAAAVAEDDARQARLELLSASGRFP